VSVYMVIEIQVLDPALYSEYATRVPHIVAKHGGHYLVRGGKVTPVSGTWNPERIILIEFPSMDSLQTCFHSAEYLEIAPFRERSTLGKSIVVEGCTES